MIGFLTPAFLAAAALVAVPLALHLFHRHRSRRLAFPALRYLQRTERDHARRIRVRQILLLVLRSAVLLLLVAAGGRLFVRGRGDAHRPTALAVVLDNSLSSGRVTGEQRVLDELKSLGERSLAAAGPEDRIWILRAGEPWDVAVPGGREAALARLRDTDVSAAAADLPAALARARELVATAGLPGAEIHLLSDLQATAFPPDAAPPRPGTEGIPVVTWQAAVDTAAANHFIGSVEVGAGLPPLANQRTDVAVSVGAGPGSDTAALPVRLVIEDRIRGAGTVRPGGTLLLPVGPFPRGEVHGWVETDPDQLRDDDRRPFVFSVQPPVPMVVQGPAGFFLERALDVLEEDGRARLADPDAAWVVFAGAGAGWTAGRPERTLVVVPPTDPTLLPALNRRLGEAGIPWRYAPPVGRGETTLAESRLPVDLAEVRVLRHYGLGPAGDVPEGGVPITMSGGAPFLAEGHTGRGPYLLLAAPPDPDWTTLPVSAAMLPLLEWMVSRAAGEGPASSTVTAGDPVSTGAGADAVETPSGTRFPVDGTQSFARTREVGVYTVLRSDSVAERIAVVPPTSESLLAPVERDVLRRTAGPGLVTVAGARAWEEGIFATRQGPELWRPLLIAALALLVVEGWAAGAGSIRRTSGAPVVGGSEGGEPPRAQAERAGARKS